MTSQDSSLQSSNTEFSPNQQAVVTPWKVIGQVDYSLLVEQFGAEMLDAATIERFQLITGKSMHPWIRRGIFFSHRCFNDILDAYENKQTIFLYTGRGPTSDALHIGHLIPFMFTKWLQEVLDCYLVIQISDDEKFYFKEMEFEAIHQLGFENAKDIIAVGFNPEKTFIFSNRDYRFSTSEYEGLVAEMNKRVSFKTLQKVFGFDEHSNIGMISWPVYQTAAAFYQAYPHLFPKGKKSLCLVAYAIDQDPYFRLARNLAKKLTNSSISREVFYAPCSIMCTFLPPLTGFKNEDSGKMSSSISNQSTIFLIDDATTITSKVKQFAFSGGGGNGSLADHRKYGGKPEIDIPCLMLRYFEDNDSILQHVEEGFRRGEITCGQTKEMLINKLIYLITKHQEQRTLVTDQIVEFFYSKWKFMKVPLDIYAKRPIMSYPGTKLNSEMIPIISENIIKQLNNIGTHTQGFDAEGGFEVSQNAELQYIYWIGQLFYKNSKNISEVIDGHFTAGATESNIEGLWILRNMFLSTNRSEIYVYMTRLTHYSIVKACNLIGIPQQHQKIIPLNEKTEMNREILQNLVKTFDQSKGHIIVLTLGTTITGSCDKIRKINEICQILDKDCCAIHIDAAFGGHSLPFLTDKPYGFENDRVMTIALDAHKNGGLPYPAGIFLCRKNLQNYIQLNVPYILGHSDNTVSGSRSAIPAIVGQWFINQIGFEGQKLIIENCMNAKNELLKRLPLKYIRLLPHSKYINQIAIEFYNISENKRVFLEKKYELRSTNIDGAKIYKILVMPHVIPLVDQFINDVSLEEISSTN